MMKYPQCNDCILLMKMTIESLCFKTISTTFQFLNGATKLK